MHTNTIKNTESIDEKYYYEAGETAIVQVDGSKPYQEAMLAQAERVLAYMKKHTLNVPLNYHAGSIMTLEAILKSTKLFTRQ